MNKYYKARYDVGSQDSGRIQGCIGMLKEDGWKSLSFHIWHTDMESSCTISGLKPYTKAELRQMEADKRCELKKEFTELKRLAKKFGYKLMK